MSRKPEKVSVQVHIGLYDAFVLVFCHEILGFFGWMCSVVAFGAVSLTW
jgi:hypothetical protein